MDNTTQSIISTIQNKGYAQIPTSLEEKLLEETTQAFKEFDRKVPHHKKEQTFMTYCSHKGIYLGQQEKSKSKGKDNKSLFHYNPCLLEHTSLNDPHYKQFIEAIHEVYRESARKINEFMDEMRELNLVHPNWRDNNPFTNVRILNYKPIDKDKLAKPHTDKGAFTGAIYETHPGLTFYPPGKSVPVSYSPGTLKLFPGDDWPVIFNREVEPLRHEVIQTNSNRERSAIVVFNNPIF